MHARPAVGRGRPLEERELGAALAPCQGLLENRLLAPERNYVLLETVELGLVYVLVRWI
jgi:hypothetical protein